VHSPIVWEAGRSLGLSAWRSEKDRGRVGLTASLSNVVSTAKSLYYWSEQRGCGVAKEWLAKWYLIPDAITTNRTDAAW
jgi:hypothetical protein